MEKKLKPGDKVYHNNLKLYGTFVGYAWEQMRSVTWIL